MPFTPSHIAAVVPLMASNSVRRHLDPWALAFGTMMPDLPLFLPFVGAYQQWHSPPGVLLYSIPVTLGVLAIFQGICRDPLTALLPPAFAGKMAVLPRSSWRRLPAAAVGAVIGFATHVLWDSFTHSWYRRYWGWEWLGASVIGDIAVYRIFQYSSSIIGLGVVLWWALRNLARRRTRAVPDRLVLSAAVRRAVLAVTLLGTGLAGLTWPYVDPPNSPTWAGTLVKTGEGVIVGCCAVLAAYVVIWQLKHALGRRARPAGGLLRE